MTGARTGTTLLVATALAVAAFLSPAPAAAATWVIKGHGNGHGVGMSQWGAYGFAKHGKSYRGILGHYFKRTRVATTRDSRIRVLLDSGAGSVGFGRATKACGTHLHRHRHYRFVDSGSNVILLARTGRRLANCGRAGTAQGPGAIRIARRGTYRGSLKAKAGSGLLVLNVVHLDAYAKGVVANEVPSSWPQAALRAQTVAARSYALGVGGGQSFDVYDDSRSQVYGGKRSETARTNRAVERTSDQVVKYRHRVATTYFSSSSGGETESIQFGFPGSDPVPYLKSVDDPYDGFSPDHSWRVRYSQGQMESRLGGLFSGRLRRIRVLKRGDSPRIVRAKVVGSRGSSRVTGLELQGRLGVTSIWMKFVKR